MKLSAEEIRLYESQINVILGRLLEKLYPGSPLALSVIPWSSPVPSFGNLAKSEIATLGLNPSNLEFCDTSSQELKGASRRFQTLNSLGISSWEEADEFHLQAIWQSCRDYFERNPYRKWFDPLDDLLGANASYYGAETNTVLKACHLDLVPYCTSRKWSTHSSSQKLLAQLSNDSLGHLLNASPVKLLIVNGNGTALGLEQLAKCDLMRSEKPEWALNRKSGRPVRGFSMSGKVERIGEVTLKSPISVIGFNHNLQGSFGVRKEVKASIKTWVQVSIEQLVAAQ